MSVITKSYDHQLIPMKRGSSGPITGAPIEEINTQTPGSNRKCGCLQTSKKLKKILASFPAPPPPTPLITYDKASGYAYGRVETQLPVVLIPRMSNNMQDDGYAMKYEGEEKWVKTKNCKVIVCRPCLVYGAAVPILNNPQPRQGLQPRSGPQSRLDPQPRQCWKPRPGMQPRQCSQPRPGPQPRQDPQPRQGPQRPQYQQLPQPLQPRQQSKSWKLVSDLVMVVQLSVTAAALVLYYLIYCYMQIVYYLLKSAMYFHNADGPMKVTIGVVTGTTLIIAFNILLRIERIIGIVY